MTTSRLMLVLLVLVLVPVAAHAQNFVPLTGLPGLQDVASTSTLSTFFNTLYRLCIGAASVIAVLQIIRAGMMWMLEDTSITKKGEARELIVSSIFGLVLVLSPAIVFGVIDPRILNLSLDFSVLQVAEGDPITNEEQALQEASGRALELAYEHCDVQEPEGGSVACFEEISAGGITEEEGQQCFPGATEEEVACVIAQYNAIRPTDIEASSGLATCTINGQTYPPVASGQSVSSDAQRSCCLIQGYHLVPNPMVEGSYTCYANQPEDSGDPEEVSDVTEENQNGTTVYKRSFAMTPQHYAILLGTKNDPEHEGCWYLAFGAYESQSSCSEALTEAQSDRSGWQTLASCMQGLSDSFPVQMQEPICSAAERID